MASYSRLKLEDAKDCVLGYKGSGSCGRSELRPRMNLFLKDSGAYSNGEKDFLALEIRWREFSSSWAGRHLHNQNKIYKPRK